MADMFAESLGRRILVAGTPGSGKTTLAGMLGRVTGLPVIHLDRLSHTAGWTPVPADSLRERLLEVMAADGWIIEGETEHGLDVRLAAADTIIYLDLNRYVCLFRLFKRMLTGGWKPREDVAPGCEDRVNRDLVRSVRWIWDFDAKHRSLTVEQLRNLASTKKVVRLAGPAELNSFERELREHGL